MKTFLTIIFLLITTLSFSDEIQCPVSCYPKQLQSKFYEKGYKLDLSANDRDEKSWGFIDSRGSNFSIFTYRQVTPKELSDVKTIVLGE